MNKYNHDGTFKKRNWIFLSPEKLKKESNFKNNHEKVNFISSEFKSYSKIFSSCLKEILENENYIDLKNFLTQFDTDKPKFDDSSHLNIQNVSNSSSDRHTLMTSESVSTLLSDIEDINDLIDKISTKKNLKVYTRKHMQWLLKQEKLYEHKNESTDKNYGRKGILKEKKNHSLKKIKNFCKWAEENFGEGTVSFDELINSIKEYLPFISILTEFTEAETNCIERIKNLPTEIYKKHVDDKIGKDVPCVRKYKKNEAELKQDLKLQKISNDINQKNKNLMHKIMNAPGVKLYIDYAKMKRNGRGPFGI
jgi:hypothetical protein